MMIDYRCTSLLLLLLAACGPAGESNLVANGAHAGNSLAPPQLRLHIAATYDGALLPDHVTLGIRNDEAFPVCFSFNDLLPGSATTFVRDGGGRVLNDSPNEALEEFRGINLAGPVTVLRPGKTHSELMNLENYHLGRTPITLQIGFGAFPCRDLVDGGRGDVRPVFFQNVFRIANGRISELERRFEVGEEPPPRR